MTNANDEYAIEMKSCCWKKNIVKGLVKLACTAGALKVGRFYGGEIGQKVVFLFVLDGNHLRKYTGSAESFSIRSIDRTRMKMPSNVQESRCLPGNQREQSFILQGVKI